MSPRPRKKSSTDPARSKGRNRRQSNPTVVSVDSPEQPKKTAPKMQQQRQKELKHPDPQLPTVEKALQSLELSAFSQKDISKKALGEKVTELVELLTNSLFIDVLECRQQRSYPDESKASSGTPSASKQLSASDDTPKVVEKASKPKRETQKSSREATKTTKGVVKPTRSTARGASKSTSRDAPNGTPKDAPKGTPKDTPKGTAKTSKRTIGSAKGPRQLVKQAVEQAAVPDEIETIDVDKETNSDADTNSTVSDPYLQRVAVGHGTLQFAPSAPTESKRRSERSAPLKRDTKSRGEKEVTPRKRAKTANHRKEQSAVKGSAHEVNEAKTKRRTSRKVAEEEDDLSSIGGSVFMDTVLEEEVILNEGNGNVDFPEDNTTKAEGQKSPAKGVAPLPWWRAVESRMILPAKSSSNDEVLRNYILAVIRSCVRDSWKADALRNSYERDPASSKGRAFLSVSAALLMLERARHIGHCRTKWKHELIQELSSRRMFQWSNVQSDPSFRQFVGCEACLGHRPATRRLWLSGAKYDSRNFWPTRSIIDVLGANEDEDGSLKVAVELNANSRAGQLLNSNQARTEFWVDAQCLRKCLVFHELVHSTSILEDDIRLMIEDSTLDGIIDVPKLQKAQKSTLEERLQRQLVYVLSQDQEFLERRMTHLHDILRLGDVYFSAGDAEVLDAGGTSSARHETPRSKIHDAPLDLNDDDHVFRERIRKLESLTEKKPPGDLFSNSR